MKNSISRKWLSVVNEARTKVRPLIFHNEFTFIYMTLHSNASKSFCISVTFHHGVKGTKRRRTVFFVIARLLTALKIGNRKCCRSSIPVVGSQCRHLEKASYLKWSVKKLFFDVCRGVYYAGTSLFLRYFSLDFKLPSSPFFSHSFAFLISFDMGGKSALFQMKIMITKVGFLGTSPFFLSSLSRLPFSD